MVGTFFNSPSSNTHGHEMGSPHAKGLEGVRELPRYQKRQKATSIFCPFCYSLSEPLVEAVYGRR